jgi:hypothetical protein
MVNVVNAVWTDEELFTIISLIVGGGRIADEQPYPPPHVRPKIWEAWTSPKDAFWRRGVLVKVKRQSRCVKNAEKRIKNVR